MLQLSMKSVHTGPTQIQYILVGETDYIFPNKFYLQAFQNLRYFPKDLIQLTNPQKYFSICCCSNYHKSLNLFVFPQSWIGDDPKTAAAIFKEYSGIWNQDIVKVFFIDASLQQHQHIGAFVAQIPFGYAMLVGEISPEHLAFYNHLQIVVSANQLITMLQQRLPEINTLLKAQTGFQLDTFTPTTDGTGAQLNPRYPANVSENNYYLLNQIFGNYWTDGEKVDLVSPDQIQEHRVDFQINQIITIDQCYHKIIQGKYVTPVEPRLPPLVIAGPYHFPEQGSKEHKPVMNKLDRDRLFLLKSEQNLNYSYNIDDDRTELIDHEGVGQLLAVINTQLRFLDQLSYLHALFCFSPFFRLPLIGRSINSDLSHFLKNFPTRKNALQKIIDFGNKFQEKVLDDRFKELLKKRNGQLVIVSDLPVEWLKLGKYPLALSHDLCRLPERNINSLYNNVIQNQRILYSIDKNIVSKTLIVHCAGDKDTLMHKHFAVIDSKKNELGYNSVICSTVEAVKAAVKKFQPELLIFDCHGNYDKKTSSSYLILDERKKVYLTGEDVIKHGIAAPIVFVSACNTAPNFGFVLQLYDAFFQAGAFTVTATYLPIEMSAAAKLIFRLINNLKQHESKVISMNWLSFLCHTMRATVIYDAIEREVKKKTITENWDYKRVAEILLNLMVFETRLNAFEQVTSYLKELNPAIDVDFTQLDNEWLSYTIMGRADLVYFDNWAQAHQRLHIDGGLEDMAK